VPKSLIFHYYMAHEENLAIRICQGLRPNSNYPQLIIKQWDADPLKRPKAEGLSELFWDLYKAADKEDSAFYKQIKETDEINKNLPSSLTGTVYSSELYK
jgi:hypothetical protein